MSKRFPFLQCVAGLAVGVLFASAAKAQHAEGPLVAPPAQSELRQWISQLGETSYAVREAASQALLNAGIPAVPLLREGQKDQDPEIASRSEQIINAIASQIAWKQREDFLSAMDTAPELGPPGWKAFRGLVGDNEAIREFFLEMHEYEPALMGLAEADAKLRLEYFDARVNQLELVLRNSRTVAGRVNQQAPSLSPAALASLFFLGSLEGPQSTTAVARICRLTTYSDPNVQLTASKRRDIWNSLFTAYITSQVDEEHPANSRYVQQLFTLGLKYNLEGIVEPAKAILADSLANPLNEQEPFSGQPSTMLYAVFAVARFGDEDAVELLARHIPDNRECWTYHVNNEVRKTQVGDAALAMCLHLRGQNVMDYNYDRLTTAADTIYAGYSLSFVDDKQRKISRDRWEEFLKTGKPPQLEEGKNQTGDDQANGAEKDGVKINVNGINAVKRIEELRAVQRAGGGQP